MIENTPSTTFLNELKSYEHYIIAGHTHPDGDCIASQLALSLLLKKMGKNTTLVSAGPFTRPELAPWKDTFTAQVPAPSKLPSRTAVVVVDVSTLERTGDPAKKLAAFPLLVIDHHSSGVPFGDHVYINPQSPSATLLIQQIMEAWGIEPDKELADLLFFGFCTDTGFFRHLDNNNFPVFALIHRLVEAGASPREGYFAINGGRTLASRKLLARLIERTEPLFEGRLLLTWETLEDRRHFQTQDRDSDRLYELLLTIEGCEGICAVREESPGSFSVGLRSLHSLDVGKLALALGGGGHARAAGCLLKSESLETAKAQMIQVFSDILR